MLIIRFSRTGKKNKAQFRIVLAEKSAPIKGRFIERLGSYDPHTKKVVFKSERINYWIKEGAKVSDSVWNLLVSQKVVQGPKRVISLTPKKKGDEEGSEEKSKENKIDQVTKKEEESKSDDKSVEEAKEEQTEDKDNKEEEKKVADNNKSAEDEKKETVEEVKKTTEKE